MSLYIQFSFFLSIINNRTKNLTDINQTDKCAWEKKEDYIAMIKEFYLELSARPMVPNKLASNVALYSPTFQFIKLSQFIEPTNWMLIITIVHTHQFRKFNDEATNENYLIGNIQLS